MLQKRDCQQTKCTRGLAHLEKFRLNFSSSSFAIRVNPLTPGAFRKKFVFLDILVVFTLDLGQISFNLAENAFATRQRAFLATGSAFYDVSTRPCAEIKILSLGFSIFGIFFRLSFFSFSFLFAAVIDFLLGLLAVKKRLRKHHRDRQFLPWSSQV